MIERINKFDAQLNLHGFAQMNILAQAKIDVVDWIDSYLVQEEWERPQVVDGSGAVC